MTDDRKAALSLAVKAAKQDRRSVTVTIRRTGECLDVTGMSYHVEDGDLMANVRPYGWIACSDEQLAELAAQVGM